MMDKNNKQALLDRIVFTEGPSHYIQDKASHFSNDKIDPIMLNKLKMNHKLAAILGNDLNQEEIEAYQENEDDEYEYIDIDNLPNDQQQYFLEDQYESDSKDESFSNQQQIQFNEDLAEIDEDEDGIDSDYGDNLIEVYQNDGNEEDINNYKRIHLMDKGSAHQEDEDKYQCPETGAHFEFLEMSRRLKTLKTKRTIIDQEIEQEDLKARSMLASRISKNKESEQKPRQTENQIVISQNVRQLAEAIKKKRANELRQVENIIQTKDQNKVIQAKVKKFKEPYIEQPLPTENLMTEEGLYSSFHIYGRTQDNRQHHRVISGSSNKQELIIQDKTDKKEDIISSQSRSKQVVCDDNQLESQVYCCTETGEEVIQRQKKGNSKKISLNNFFSNEPINRNIPICNIDCNTQLPKDAFTLSKEIINKQIQLSNIARKMNDKNQTKRLPSANSNKNRANSSGMKQTSQQKNTQIQQLLLSFYHNQEVNSRTNKMTETSTKRKSSKPQQSIKGMEPKILSDPGKNNSKNFIHNTYANQEYSNIGSTINQNPKVVRKFKLDKAGLMARGNTLDNRNTQHSKTASGNQHFPGGSYSTTVGFSSSTASRPGSGIKKKQHLSPTHSKTSKIVSTKQNTTDFKNLLYHKNKPDIKVKGKEKTTLSLNKSNINMKNSSKGSCTLYKAKAKTRTSKGQGLIFIDQNNLALEEILKQQLDHQQVSDHQYQTFHQGIDLLQNNNKKSSILLNSASAQKQKPKQQQFKVNSSKSRQKSDIQKLTVQTRNSLINHHQVKQQDPLKLDINNIIKKLGISNANFQNPLSQSQMSKAKSIKSTYHTQKSSITNNILSQALSGSRDEKLQGLVNNSKRYSSIKTSCVENFQVSKTKRNRSKDSKNIGSSLQNQILLPFTSNGAAPVVQQSKINHYDFRSERCETVS